jgi:hypothetical protein
MSGLPTILAAARRFGLALMLVFLLPGGVSVAYEEPDFTVVATANDYEIRRYEPFLVAEVDVSGDFDEAGSAAFRVLAAYIFGKNVPAVGEAHKVSEAHNTKGADEGVKMAMTVPVLSTETAPGAHASYTYSFVMPSGFSLASLPKPLDERVRIREMPGRLVAARRYSGRWTEARFVEHEAALREGLARDGVEADRRTLFARYNGPWTPWFMRRNEILIPVVDRLS